jgi:DNA-directed RNA polymerase specialized sigma24 family protein
VLEQLAKKDKLWREVAFRITNNLDAADELVQKMYIKMSGSSLDISKLNDNYFKITLVNLFKDSKKNPYQTISIDDCSKTFVTKEDNFSYTDRDYFMIKKLSKDDKKLLMLSYDKSVRQMSEDYNCSYVTIYRRLIKIRKRLLKDDYEKEYRNKRLKYKR